jgi:hypothetical protein
MIVSLGPHPRDLIGAHRAACGPVAPGWGDGNEQQMMSGVSEADKRTRPPTLAPQAGLQGTVNRHCQLHMADLTMLRRELVIGQVIAGSFATLAPSHV